MSPQPYWLHPPYYRGIIHIAQRSKWFISLLAVLGAILVLNLSQGGWKPIPDWSWFSIAAKIAAAFFVSLWLFLVLSILPSGPVTNWLGMGFLGLFAACIQSLMKEWIQIPTPPFWNHWIIPLSIGFVGMTVALFLWKKEQCQLDRHLIHYLEKKPASAKKKLPDASHLPIQLEKALTRNSTGCRNQALLLLDISTFMALREQYGDQEAEHFLFILKKYIHASLRPQDELCQLQNERFAIILKEVDLFQAEQMAITLESLVKQFRYCLESDNAVINAQATMVTIMANEGCPNSLLEQAKQALKQRNKARFSMQGINE